MKTLTPQTTARGVFYVHSAPSALLPHVEWAVANAIGGSSDLAWVKQPAEPGTYRAELSWQATYGAAANLASSLRGWQQLRFEVTEEPTSATEGARYSYTPTLGLMHATVGVHGDILIPEDRIKAIRAKAAAGEIDVDTALDALLGSRWDEELEPFRHAGDGAPVRWLHQVV